jgi:nicotinamidase-related amidase
LRSSYSGINRIAKGFNNVVMTQDWHTHNHMSFASSYPDNKPFETERQRGIDTVFITGLATDFCVAWTAVDARHAGLTTYFVEDACRAIDVNGSLAKAWADMTAAGVKRNQSSDLAI